MAGTKWKSLFPPRAYRFPISHAQRYLTLSLPLEFVTAVAFQVPAVSHVAALSFALGLVRGVRPESASSGWRTNLVALRPLISPHLGSHHHGLCDRVTPNLEGGPTLDFT
jgi:hypothetical protein